MSEEIQKIEKKLTHEQKQKRRVRKLQDAYSINRLGRKEGGNQSSGTEDKTK